MKSLGLFTQIMTLGLSVAIVFVYIEPTFADIGQLQDDISRYQDERQDIERVNADLDRYVATIESLNGADIDRLAVYMPTFVDDISVMRDLQFIADASGVILKSVSYGGSETSADASGGQTSPPTRHEFSLAAEGTYSQVKNLLSLLEQNEYPLEVHTADIAPLEGGFLSVSLLLVTYADTSVSVDENN